MEITGKLPPVYGTQGVTARQPVRDIDKAGAATAKTDRVALSQEARELQAAHKAVHSMPNVDVEKVARIKAQLEKGTYKVDAQHIAGKMLEETLLTRQD